jgi:hypothetical protein
MSTPYYERLTSGQSMELRASVEGAIATGLFGRYHTTLAENINMLGKMAALAGDPSAPAFEQRYTEAQKAYGAEAPLVFFETPSNLATFLVAAKVDPVTGNRIVPSEVTVGLYGGPVGGGRPSYDFTAEDVMFGRERLEAQRRSGLFY